MEEAYRGEIADWYDDSEDYEKVVMLGKRCLGVLGYPIEYYKLPKALKDKVKKLFSYDIS